VARLNPVNPVRAAMKETLRAYRGCKKGDRLIESKLDILPVRKGPTPGRQPPGQTPRKGVTAAGTEKKKKTLECPGGVLAMMKKRKQRRGNVGKPQNGLFKKRKYHSKQGAWIRSGKTWKATCNLGGTIGVVREWRGKGSYEAFAQRGKGTASTMWGRKKL